MDLKHVDGENRGHIVLYALSTCVWCKKTKRLLNDLGVEYYYLDVDLADDKDRAEAKNEIERFHHKISFPTIIIDDERSIQGFKEEEIKEAFAL